MKSDLLEYVDDIDIISELDTRGISGRKIGDNYMICCPYHGERNPSFGISFKGNRKGMFNCFSCSESGTFFHLISFLDGITLKRTVKKFISGEMTSKVLKNIQSKFLEGIKTKTTKNKIRILKKSILKKYKIPYGDYLEYLLKVRRFSKDDISKWKILCCDEGKWKRRVIFPVPDRKGRLIGITARKIDEVDKIYKVRKVKNTDVKKVLYGIRFIKKGSPLVIVEGECDAIYLHRFGIPAVCISGNSISETQIKKIIKFTDKAVLSFDGDLKYKNAKMKASVRKEKDKLIKYIDVDIVKLPEDKDPNALSSSQVKKYYKEYLNLC